MDLSCSPGPEDLVAAFATADSRIHSYTTLVSMGRDAVPALREGLRSDCWQVRRWSAMCLDQVADAEALVDLVPLLEDPKANVRLWAVHSISCEHCKDDVVCPIDVVPLLIERLERDDSIKVRRMAAAMLGSEFADRRCAPVFEQILKDETDRKLRHHAASGLRHLAASAASGAGQLAVGAGRSRSSACAY